MTLPMQLRRCRHSIVTRFVFALGFAASACGTSSESPNRHESTGGAVGTGGNSGTGGSSNAGAGTSGKGGGQSSAGSPNVENGGASSGGSPQTGTGGTTGVSGATGSGGSFEQCAGPSIDRLKTWGPTEVEGMTAVPPPTTPSVLVKDGDHYVAKLAFSGSGWGVAQVLLQNKAGVAADLSASSGMTVTYSSTADFYFQMRAKSSWSGGHHYRALFPSTDGAQKTITMTFEAENWSQPSWAESLDFASVKKEVLGFTLATENPNTFVFYGLRVDGHVPECN